LSALTKQCQPETHSLLCAVLHRFRKPKHSYQHHKSEVASRHSAFTRGSAYLERYCLLIAFGAYLEEVTAGMAAGLSSYRDGTLPSFADWLSARPELSQVRGCKVFGVCHAIWKM
jgi:hypothetical protein